MINRDMRRCQTIAKNIPSGLGGYQALRIKDVRRWAFIRHKRRLGAIADLVDSGEICQGVNDRYLGGSRISAKMARTGEKRVE
jgi:hypothetical protein